MVDETNDDETNTEISAVGLSFRGTNSFTKDEKLKLVSFFKILIEIDQRNDKKNNENKNI